MTGTLSQTNGTTNNTGTITGNVTMANGRINNSGTLTGTLGQSGGRFDHGLGAGINGAVTLSGGIFNADGGTFGGPVAVSGSGILRVNANTSANLDNAAGGEIGIFAGVTLTGNLTQTGGETLIA
ncbi:MAG: hypothetical protein JJT81_14130 [Rubellimicrobium sp.]|nr:hypothetical protein [Rubellimicrobium sp.]